MNRATLRLALVFLLLAAVSVGLRLGGQGRFAPGDVEQGSQKLFASLDRGKLASISIRGPGEQAAELARSGERWVVSSAGRVPADLSAVGRLLEELVELRRGVVVARSLADLERYELTGPDAVHVTARGPSGEILAELRVGKQLEFEHTFVQVVGEEAVRKVPGNVRASFLNRRAGGFRDHTILYAGGPSEVRRIRIEGPESTLVLARTEETGAGSGWVMEAPEQGPAVAWMCEALARYLSQLQCDRFHDGDLGLADLGLEPPDHVIRAERADGTETVLHLGSRVLDGLHPVKLPGAPTIWLIADYLGNAFKRSPSAYLEER